MLSSESSEDLFDDLTDEEVIGVLFLCVYIHIGNCYPLLDDAQRLMISYVLFHHLVFLVAMSEIVTQGRNPSMGDDRTLRD